MTKWHRFLLFGILVGILLNALLLITGCAVAPAATQMDATEPAAPTTSAAPVATPEPTPTAKPEPTPFSFAWMSDTQEYAANRNDIFCGMTQWIADTQTDYNTILTIHTGDMIRGSYKDYQWDNMKAAFALLPADMRILTVGGNHDLESFWDQYTPYLDHRPDTDLNPDGFFDPDGYARFLTFEAGGVPFLIFSISYGYEREAESWINETCQKYADHFTILCFHSYLDPGGYSSVGRYLLDSVVGANPNIRMVLCGHEPGAAYLPVEFDDDGDGTMDRTVFQMMFNLQHEQDGGGGYLRILRFDPAKDTIEVVTYSPYLDKFGCDLNYGDDFGESKILEDAGLGVFLKQ